MIKKVLIRPKKGLLVRKPVVHFPLKADGEMIILDTYWKRRLACGDCEYVEQVKKPKGDNKKPKNLNKKENFENDKGAK